MLLRLAVGLVTLVQGALYLTNSGAFSPALAAIGGVAALAGVALALGFLTPAAGSLIALGITASAFYRFPSTPYLFDGTLPALFAGIVSTAIVLLGPGAFSIDARLFGRREIIIPPASRPRL